MEEGIARAIESSHVTTQANVYLFTATFEAVQGDVNAARRAGQTVVELSREHDLSYYAVWGALPNAWARARLEDYESGVAEFREALETFTGQGHRTTVPLYQGLLAELEAERVADAALTRIGEALALASKTGEHWTDSFLHRIRGEILLKRDPANSASAEEAFLTAIAIAQQQKAPSFELRAALSLAKLYQNANRFADAHAVLVPALEGFAPTTEFPEIAEAQMLLAALSATDEVKNAAASRQQRLRLQLNLGNALIAARGHGAPETTAAFARARDLAAGIEDAAERFSVYYGLYAGSIMRGELAPLLETTETILHDVESRPDSPEAAVAHRLGGMTKWYVGDYIEARAHLERALAIFDPVRDRDLAFRVGQDIGVSAMAYSALVLWPLGAVDRARRFADDMVARALQTGHVATAAYGHCHFAWFELLRRNPAAAAPHVAAFVDLAREHGMLQYTAYGTFLAGWIRAGSQELRLAEMRRGVALCREQGIALYIPLIATALAEAEADAGDINAALAVVDRTIEENARTGQRWFEAETNRIRGEILWKRDPANAAPAEEAFLTAITVAQRQKARSFELRAALSLAKLYQSTYRVADAHAVLAPALESFSPTPEFPQIAEAQALLAALW
jgi:predicted ATPase